MAIRSDVTLADSPRGDPELRHLIADGTRTVSYQVSVGLVSQLKPELDPAVIGALSEGRITMTPRWTRN